MSPREQAFYRDAGRRIRAYRTRMGMSQERLAAMIGAPRTSVVNIEQGRQGIDAYRLGQLSHIFGMVADDLIRGPIPESVKVKRSRPPLWRRVREALRGDA